MTHFFNKTKLAELENKILDVKTWATETTLTAFENKIPNVGRLVEKTNYNTKISELEKKLLIMIMTTILLVQSLIL